MSMSEAAERAIAGMHWLSPADDAAVELARSYAQMIDEADDPVKVAGWHGPHLLNTLKELGGTPTARANMSVETEVKGKLALLREKRRGA